jgi:hypothetical protein
MVDEISKVFDQNRENANSGTTKEINNRRTDPRIPYSGFVFFSTKRGFFEGELTNYSKHGLFIKTQANLSVGDVITVALPYVEHEEVKFQAQVLRRNNGGYGLELFRERNDNDLKTRKIEAKSK